MADEPAGGAARRPRGGAAVKPPQDEENTHESVIHLAVVSPVFLCAFQTSTSAAPSRVCVTEESAPTPPAAMSAAAPEVTSPARTAPDVWVSRQPAAERSAPAAKPAESEE